MDKIQDESVHKSTQLINYHRLSLVTLEALMQLKEIELKPAWIDRPIKSLNNETLNRARERQSHLTKPPGALGRLEDLAIRLASMQGRDRPHLERISIVVFAADHGIMEENVSAFPQTVTTEMIKNFSAGGAAISVLAATLNARLEVVNLGTIIDPGQLPGVVSQRIAPCTANICKEPAMTSAQLQEALNVGYEAVQRVLDNDVDLFIGGEMGIGNTAVATAIACALLNEPAESLTGPGTGLNPEGVKRKAKIIQSALDLHTKELENPLSVLRCIGGFEIAALTGAFITCSQAGVPVLVDGFIATVAALVAVMLKPDCVSWFFFSHASAEPGHRKVLEKLNGQPLLDRGMRLGEGSGAAVALPLLRMACDLHNNMATFAEAGVSNA